MVSEEHIFTLLLLFLCMFEWPEKCFHST